MEDSLEEQAWQSTLSKNSCNKKVWQVTYSILEAKGNLVIISLSLL